MAPEKEITSCPHCGSRRILPATRVFFRPSCADCGRGVDSDEKWLIKEEQEDKPWPELDALIAKHKGIKWVSLKGIRDGCYVDYNYGVKDEDDS